MTAVVHDVEQRSCAWRALRAGRLCASKAGDMMAGLVSGKEPASRRNLRAQLVLERLTGKPQDSPFQSDAMKQGVEREATALDMYEALNCVEPERVGFLTHPVLMAGGSPDGFVGSDGIVEAKCPMPATHLEYYLTQKVPFGYQQQVRHLLWLTGREWCDWFSYGGPDFPEDMQIVQVRMHRSDLDLAIYERCVIAFLDEVDAQVQKTNMERERRKVA